MPKTVKKTTKKSTTKTPKQRVPYLVSKNHSIKPLRTQRNIAKGNPERHPLGTYKFPVAIIHGSRSENAYERVRQAQQGGGIVINHPDAIRNASDKLRAKRLFEQAGIPTTPFMASEDLLVNGRFQSSRMTLNYPVVAKLRKGMGGKGMTLISNVEELRAWRKKVKTKMANYFLEEAFNFGENREYSTQDHNKYTREYRVGVSPLLNGRTFTYAEETRDDNGNLTGTENVQYMNGCIVALRKLMRSEASREGAFGRNLALGNAYFVRNFKKDYDYTKRGIRMNWEEGIQICQAACEALGLDYGAVDLLWSSRTGEWCVVEVNTAPSMGDPSEGHAFTLSQWKQAFRNMIQVRRDQLGL